MNLINKSGLECFAEAVLLIPYMAEIHKSDSMIVLPESYNAHAKALENRGIVLEIGPESWTKPGQRPRCKVGAKVIVSKSAGAQVIGPEDGLIYRVVNADDIYMGIRDGLDVEEFLKKAGYFNE